MDRIGPRRLRLLERLLASRSQRLVILTPIPTPTIRRFRTRSPIRRRRKEGKEQWE
jgi:hypothetical protein